MLSKSRTLPSRAVLKHSNYSRNVELPRKKKPYFECQVPDECWFVCVFFFGTSQHFLAWVGCFFRVLPNMMVYVKHATVWFGCELRTSSWPEEGVISLVNYTSLHKVDQSELRASSRIFVCVCFIMQNGLKVRAEEGFEKGISHLSNFLDIPKFSRQLYHWFEMSKY